MWILDLLMYFKAENMDRTQEVWTWFTASNFNDFVISKYHQKGHVPLHISFYIKKCFWRSEKAVCYSLPFQLSYPLYLSLSMLFRIYTQVKLWHKSSSFLPQHFCATPLLSADPQDLAFDPSGIRQKRQNFIMWSASGLLNKANSKSL